MAALDNASAHQFWQQFQDPTIYRVICFMESVEGWTVDGQIDAEAGLSALEKALDNVGNIELKNEEGFIDILAYIKTGRGLRLLMALDTAYPGAASKIIAYADQKSKEEGMHPAAHLFIQRNMVFEKLRLLGRVFSHERIKLVTNALEGSYD